MPYELNDWLKAKLDALLDQVEIPDDAIWEFLKQPLGGPRKHEPDGYEGGTMCYECDPPHSIIYGGEKDADQRENSPDDGRA
jgi:hypothetical protein